jgi:hypothetical protein
MPSNRQNIFVNITNTNISYNVANEAFSLNANKATTAVIHHQRINVCSLIAFQKLAIAFSLGQLIDNSSHQKHFLKVIARK